MYAWNLPVNTGFLSAIFNQPMSFPILSVKLPQLLLKNFFKIPELKDDLTEEQVEKIKIIKKHFDFVTSLKDDLQKIIFNLAFNFKNEINLILTVPGFKNPLSAISVISEIGTNMDVFPTSKHLCS